jgi:hypothetical protein
MQAREKGAYAAIDIGSNSTEVIVAHLGEICVSKHGVRGGALLAYARYGEHWLDHPEVELDDSKQGKAPSLSGVSSGAGPHRETFAESASDELPKRAKKFLNWREKVLKNEDVEDVHKMRVASRRLRATMDAYEAVCKPRPFKKSYQRTKKAADLLGIVRDTDVMMQRIEDLLAHAPSEEKAGLQWLVNRLGSYRNKQGQMLETSLQNFDEDAFTQKITSCIPEGASHGKS